MEPTHAHTHTKKVFIIQKTPCTMVIICRKLKRRKKLVTHENTAVLLQRSACGFKRSKKKKTSH